MRVMEWGWVVTQPTAPALAPWGWGASCRENLGSGKSRRKGLSSSGSPCPYSLRFFCHGHPNIWGVLRDESPEGKNLLHSLSCLEIFLYNRSLPAWPSSTSAAAPGRLCPKWEPSLPPKLLVLRPPAGGDAHFMVLDAVNKPSLYILQSCLVQEALSLWSIKG